MKKEKFVKSFVTQLGLNELENKINDYIKETSADIIDVSFNYDSSICLATALVIFEK